jgi:subtilisin family serine protease
MTSLQRTTCIALCLLTTYALAQPRSRLADLLPEPAFYLAGTTRIPLKPTDQYFALPVATGNGDAFKDKINATGVLRASRSELLDRYGLLLLRRSESSTDEAVARILRENRFNPKAAPVYASKDVYVVLVNEFDLQLESRLPLCEIDALADRHPQARFTRNDIATGRYAVTVPSATARDALDVINRLAQTERACVRFVSPNFLMVFPRKGLNPPARPTPGVSATAFAAPEEACEGSPDDALFDQQWYLKNASGPDIRAVDAWTVTTGATNVVIAIIDDGVDTGHPELKTKVSGQYDVISDDTDAMPVGYYDGHGTAVAGLAAARTGNCVGIAAVGWHSLIYSVRAFAGTEQEVISMPLVIEKGIRKAIESGAQVINMSVSGGYPLPAIEAAIDDAIAASRTLVFSAGNGSNGVNYPASLASQKTVIAVAATDAIDNLKTPASPDHEPWGSNSGPEVSVAAPGVGILTTDRPGGAGFVSTDYYRLFNGTSAATPLVSGAAALIYSVCPEASPALVRKWIHDESDPVGTKKKPIRRLNAFKSVKAAAQSCASPGRPNPPRDFDNR